MSSSTYWTGCQAALITTLILILLLFIHKVQEESLATQIPVEKEIIPGVIEK